MDKRRCEIEFEGEKINVKLEGMWTRANIVTAYNVLLSKLPAHIMELRKEMEDGKRRKQRKE